MGYDDQSLILLTAKNSTAMYKTADPLTKIGVSGLGLLSIALFAVGSCALQSHAQDRIDAALATGSSAELSWFVDCATSVAGSMIAIQLLHEAAHIAISWKDKVSKFCAPGGLHRYLLTHPLPSCSLRSAYQLLFRPYNSEFLGQ